SNIIIEDGHDRIQLYRHWDGYPDGKGGVLATLKYALPYAWPLLRFEAKDFAAALVRGWKDEDGGNVYIDGAPRGWELIHGDVDWVYVIRPEPEARARRDVFLGEPEVDICDWHAYQFDGDDPMVQPPRPAATVRLSAARQAALQWHRPDQR